MEFEREEEEKRERWCSRFRAKKGENPSFKTVQLGDKQDADTWRNLSDVK